MDLEQIRVLARGPVLSTEALTDRLRHFRRQGMGILICIVFVMTNRECSLSEARDLVINSPAWLDRRDAFFREQEEAFEEIIAYQRDQIDRIEMAMSSDRTTVTVHLSTPNKR